MCSLYLNLASLNSPTVAIAQADLDVAQAELIDAKSLRRPQVSAFTRSGFGDEGLVNTAIENQVGLRASQRIFDFGDSRLAREAAEEEIIAQENKPCLTDTSELNQHLDILKESGYLNIALSQNAEVKALSSLAKKLEIEAERQRRSRLPVIEVVGISFGKI